MAPKNRVKVYVASSVGLDYFFFLKRTLETAGYSVEEIFLIGESRYRQLARASSLGKIFLRIQMYLIYPAILLWKGFSCKKGSIFVVTSNTFFAPLLISYYKFFKRIKVIHMLYDLFPDALEVAGAIRRNSVLAKSIGIVTKKAQKGCDATVYLGQLLKDHAEFRWGEALKNKCVDISTDIELYVHKPDFNSNLEKIIIHYGGQLGYLHDADSIIAAVQAVLNSDDRGSIEFVFYVSGAQAIYLQKKLKGLPVTVKSAIPSHQWRKDAVGFHVGLVSLTPGGASVCLPSKTYSMMASGMAILAICPTWSDLAHLVMTNDAGWIVNNSKFNDFESLKSEENYLISISQIRERKAIVDDFKSVVIDILANRDELIRKRKNAYHKVRDLYNIDELSNKWQEVIETL